MFPRATRKVDFKRANQEAKHLSKDYLTLIPPFIYFGNRFQYSCPQQKSPPWFSGSFSCGLTGFKNGCPRLVWAACI
ncbi:MAG: hypothetical protein JWO71_3387 [Candidatus Acidoferrum typicum]|nr:hypothetical protein [Candidatus Acidoferrum typicum]